MRRHVALSLLTVLSLDLTGCYAWHADPAPVPTLQNARPGDVYRVTLANGRLVNLTGVRVRGDSVVATADSIRIVRGQVERTAIPMTIPVSAVVRVEHRAVNGGGIALGVGFGALVLGGLLAIALSNLPF